MASPLALANYGTQNFYGDEGNRGDGKISSLRSLPHDLKGNKLVVYDATGGSGRTFLDDALTAVGVDGAKIEQLDSPGSIVNACPGSLSSVSECFAAVFFDSLNEQTGELVSYSGDR
jgi:hypothetical protein